MKFKSFCRSLLRKFFLFLFFVRKASSWISRRRISLITSVWIFALKASNFSSSFQYRSLKSPYLLKLSWLRVFFTSCILSAYSLCLVSLSYPLFLDEMVKIWDFLYGESKTFFYNWYYECRRNEMEINLFFSCFFRQVSVR